MPRIPEYVAPPTGIQAPETGVEARGQAARRIGPFYHQMGQEYGGAISSATKAADEYVYHQQVSHGALGEAAILSDAADAWNKIITDPNFDPADPTVAQRFRTEYLEPKLQKFNEGFTNSRAQEWAQSRTERIRDHFLEKTGADVARAAGHAWESNVNKASNITSNTVFRDPSEAERAIKSVPDLVDTMKPPTMSAAEWAEKRQPLIDHVQRMYAEAGLHGTIKKSADPEKDADDYVKNPNIAPYISGPAAYQAAKAATTQAKANALTEKQLLTTQRALSAQAMERDFTDALHNNLRADPNKPGDFIINPNLTQELLDIADKHKDAPGVQEHFRAIASWQQYQIDKENKPPVLRDDPGTKATLLAGTADGRTKDIDILNAERLEKIKPDTARYIEGIRERSAQMPRNDPVLNAKLAGVKEILIGPVMNGIPKDPYSLDDYAKFLQLFQTEYIKKRNAGTLEPADLDTTDPHSMISTALRAATPDYQTKMQRQNEMYGRMGAGMTPGVTTGPGNVPVYGRGGGGMTGPGETITGGGAAPPPPTTLPPVSARIKGQIYNLPRGRFEWDGTKWLQR